LAYIALSNYINHRGILLTLQGRKSHQLKKYLFTKANAIYQNKRRQVASERVML
jgi:hypothetical protein